MEETTRRNNTLILGPVYTLKAERHQGEEFQKVNHARMIFPLCVRFNLSAKQTGCSTDRAASRKRHVSDARQPRIIDRIPSQFSKE
jgi:hypothetical protein